MSDILKHRLEGLVYIVLIILMYARAFYGWNGIYIDTDNYMHSLRVIAMLENYDWFEHRFMLTNYPYGEISHWTRLMDIILITCSLPFFIFHPLKQAIFIGSLFVSPLVALGLFYVLYHLACRILTFRARVLFFMLLICQHSFIKVLVFNRPDHHSVIILFAAWLMLETYSFITEGKIKYLIISSLICALSLWLAVEGFILYLLSLVFLYLAHLTNNTSYRSLKFFTISYVVFCGIFYIINPPFQGLLFLDNGRISLLYVLIATYVVFSVYLSTNVVSRLFRFLFLSFAVITLSGILWRGGLLNSPLDNNIKVAFVDRISEMQSGNGIYYLTYPILGILALMYLRYRKFEQKNLILYIGIFLTGYTVLNLWAMRFSGYTALYSSLALALFVSKSDIRRLGYTFTLLILCSTEIISFSIYSALHYDLSKEVKPIQFMNLNFIKKYNFSPGSIVTDIFMAPYIIWYTNHPVITSPYHRNVEGIVDNHRILFSDNEAEVIDLLTRHQVKTIILPYKPDEEYFEKPEENCQRLYGKIYGCHNYPEWLKLKVADEHQNILIYEVE